MVQDSLLLELLSIEVQRFMLMLILLMLFSGQLVMKSIYVNFTIVFLKEYLNKVQLLNIQITRMD